jgi:UDP:flavonoid glycosyltransferase YjiC (YdhE family)
LPGWLDPSVAIRAAIAALSELDCHAVAVTGGADLTHLPRAPHVHLVDHVPQPLLLETCDLFLTHGGYNSVREAIRAGVPMVVAPRQNDGPHNARRVAEFGLGTAVADPDPLRLLGACAAVLADAEIAGNVKRARRHVLALPSVDTAPALFGRIARKGSDQ